MIPRMRPRAIDTKVEVPIRKTVQGNLSGMRSTTLARYLSNEYPRVKIINCLSSLPEAGSEAKDRVLDQRVIGHDRIRISALRVFEGDTL